jgi:hypothetical protein
VVLAKARDGDQSKLFVGYGPDKSVGINLLYDGINMSGIHLSETDVRKLICTLQHVLEDRGEDDDGWVEFSGPLIDPEV